MIEAEELIYPNGEGEIELEWFPGEALSVNLSLWIAVGYSKATDAGITDDEDEDTVARAYANWRAFSSKAGHIAGSPNSVKVEDLAQSTGKDRLDWFGQRAAYWLNVYTSALAAGVAEVTGVASPPRSGYAMQNVVRF